jgi:hypothetical protein
MLFALPTETCVKYPGTLIQDCVAMSKRKICWKALIRGQAATQISSALSTALRVESFPFACALNLPE